MMLLRDGLKDQCYTLAQEPLLQKNERQREKHADMACLTFLSLVVFPKTVMITLERWWFFLVEEENKHTHTKKKKTGAATQ
jgi:plastocyanin domain-containing protein